MEKNSSYFVLTIVHTAHTRESVLSIWFFYFSVGHDLKRAILKGYEYPNYLTISLINLLHYNICISQTPSPWNLVIWLPPSFTWLKFLSNAGNQIKIRNIKKTQFGYQVLTWYLICASSLIPLNKPFFITFEHSANVFFPISVLVSFISPRLCFTLWHRVHFWSFNLHFVTSFSWTPCDPKRMPLFVY